MNNASAQPEGRFRIRCRYVEFGNPLRATAGFRTERHGPNADKMLFDNEVAVDVGNACWHQKGEERRILDHHFELDDVIPSASAAVLHNVRALADWAKGLASESSANQELWLTTNLEPDFDAFCSLNLARWILHGEITPEDFEGVLFAKISAKETATVNWFAPQLPSTISAAGRSAMLLASYASSVDQGRPMRTPRSRRLHAVLYAALERQRPLLDEVAAPFFNEVRRRLQAGNLNPLFDTIFEPSETSCPYARELTLLAQEETLYQRDVQRARSAYVQVYKTKTDQSFQDWFEKLEHVPFFVRSGEVDPRHLTFPGQDRVAVEGIFLRDPQSFLFKEWAREDRENSSSGEGFLFTAVACSDGLTQAPAGKRTRYTFALDPERARGMHLYKLWARLQEAEFRRKGISECPRPHEDHRPDFAGRCVGEDPWFDGNSYRGTIIDTPSSGTELRAGSTSDLSDISADTVESVLRQELEYAWYTDGQIEIWDFPTGSEADPDASSGSRKYAIAQPQGLPGLVAEHLRVGQIALYPETETRDVCRAKQIGRHLWQILEDQGVSTLPSDFETNHLVPGTHSIVVWSRRGAAIAHRGEKGGEQAKSLVDAFSSVAEIRRGLGRMLKHDSAPQGDGEPDAQVRLHEGEILTRDIIPLQLLASSPEGAALRRFFASTPFGSVLQSLHELNQGNLGLLYQEAIGRAAASVNQNVHAIKSMQTKVEYVEVFLVGMYSIYLIHYLGEAFKFHEAGPNYVGYWIIGGTLLSSTVAAWLLRPWEPDDDDPAAEEPRQQQPPHKTHTPPWRMIRVALFAIGMLTVYLFWGFYLKGHSKESRKHGGPQTETGQIIPGPTPSTTSEPAQATEPNSPK